MQLLHTYTSLLLAVIVDLFTYCKLGIVAPIRRFFLLYFELLFEVKDDILYFLNDTVETVSSLTFDTEHTTESYFKEQHILMAAVLVPIVGSLFFFTVLVLA